MLLRMLWLRIRIRHCRCVRLNESSSSRFEARRLLFVLPFSLARAHSVQTEDEAMAAAVDYSRAITASLFSSPQGSNAPRASTGPPPPSPPSRAHPLAPTAAESYIAHVQTFETVPGSPERKPRFLILSGEPSSPRLDVERSSMGCSCPGRPTQATQGKAECERLVQYWQDVGVGGVTRRRGVQGESRSTRAAAFGRAELSGILVGIGSGP